MTDLAFETAWRMVEPYTMLGQDRGRVLWDLVRECAPDEYEGGAIAELGVYKGGTAALLRHASPLRPLHLFDTFAGHPDGPRGMDNPDSHPAGRFNDTSLGAVASFLDGYRQDAPLVFYVGTFPETVFGMLPPLAFVHVDADLYDSVAAACRIFWPALEHGGVMVFDDYGFPDCVGAKRAVDEWVDADPDVRTLVLPGTGQAWVRKP